jgi:hypothetical protein
MHHGIQADVRIGANKCASQCDSPADGLIADPGVPECGVGDRASDGGGHHRHNKRSRYGVGDAVKDRVSSDNPHKGLDIHENLRSTEDQEAKSLATERLEERARA